MINIIAAISINDVIGKNGKLPWHYSADLKWFKDHTINSTVIMGRKTWDSIGKPLPFRTNIIISHNALEPEWEDCDSTLVQRWYHEQKCLEYFSKLKKIVWVIGGAQIYKIALPYVNKLYITNIPKIINGDNLVFFPIWNMSNYKRISYTQNNDDPRLYHSIYKKIKG